jgi:hypothetical protein
MRMALPSLGSIGQSCTTPQETAIMSADKLPRPSGGLLGKTNYRTRQPICLFFYL